MKPDIHPNYEQIVVTCSCDHKIQTRSTSCKNLNIEVCSQCHPFYTGTQKVIDSGGCIERFNKRFRVRNCKYVSIF